MIRAFYKRSFNTGATISLPLQTVQKKSCNFSFAQKAFAHVSSLFRSKFTVAMNNVPPSDFKNLGTSKM